MCVCHESACEPEGQDGTAEAEWCRSVGPAGRLRAAAGGPWGSLLVRAAGGP